MATTVLIVDDHATFRATARRLLESEGFDIVGEAANGQCAIEKTAAVQPEVMLLDVHLPDIDGFEVAHRLSELGHRPMVILVSSRDSVDFGSLVQACGAKGFVAKGDLSGERLRALLAAEPA